MVVRGVGGLDTCCGTPVRFFTNRGEVLPPFSIKMRWIQASSSAPSKDRSGSVLCCSVTLSKCREELLDDVTDANDALLPAVAVEVVGDVVVTAGLVDAD